MPPYTGTGISGYYPRRVKKKGEAVAVSEDIHVIFKEWTRERMASPDVTMPYHPTAVRFFKDKGVWKAEHDRAQQRLLNPR